MRSASGDIKVNASNVSNTRMIAGSLAATSGKVGVGAALNFLRNEDTITARIGDNVLLSAGQDNLGSSLPLGGLTLSAEAASDAWLITAAVAAATGASATAVGGTIA